MIEQIITQIRAAKRVQVIGHVRPDGDCIGSLIGVGHILDHHGIEHALAAAESTANGYEIIRGFDRIEPQPRPGLDADLTIFVDCADLGRAFEGWTPSGKTINIDHHGSNTRFAELNWVDPGCAAVGEMLYYLALADEVPMNPDLANALLLSIMTDTGCFQYSNVRQEHFEICGQLLKAGASVTLVAGAAYENRHPETIEMIGSVLGSLHYRCAGRLVWGELRTELVERLGGKVNLPDNLAGELRTIRGIAVSMLFTELADGGLRLSLRASGEVDVSLLAKEFGGGGHPNAAGLTIDNTPYEEARERVLAHAESMISTVDSAGRPSRTDG